MASVSLIVYTLMHIQVVRSQAYESVCQTAVSTSGRSNKYIFSHLKSNLVSSCEQANIGTSISSNMCDATIKSLINLLNDLSSLE